MSKTYVATEATVAEIRDYVKPATLANVQVLILDFTDPTLNIISGGYDSYTRTINA